jgi:hypothetical protein
MYSDLHLLLLVIRPTHLNKVLEIGLDYPIPSRSAQTDRR